MSEHELREAAFQKLKQSSRVNNPEIAWEVAFHMTDWIDNLEAVLELLNRFETMLESEVYQTLLSFCIHAPEHLRQAITQSRELGRDN